MMSIWVKSIIYLLLAVVLAGIEGCTLEEKDAGEEKETEGYGILEGDPVHFSQLLGKVVLINYWAEWCTPCRQEIPALNALQKEFPNQVLVLGVNFDGADGEELRLQTEKMGITFAQLTRDPRVSFEVTPSGVLPETLVIDRRGEFQQVLLGPQSLQTLRFIVASLPEEMAADE